MPRAVAWPWMQGVQCLAWATFSPQDSTLGANVIITNFSCSWALCLLCLFSQPTALLCKLYIVRLHCPQPVFACTPLYNREHCRQLLSVIPCYWHSFRRVIRYDEDCGAAPTTVAFPRPSLIE